MGGITSGVGIFSGINSAQLIDQLMQIEARPKSLVQQRTTGLQSQRAAFLDINTTLMALKNAATKFRTASAFKAGRADTSDSAVATATAGTNAAAGTYELTVKRLVTTQQALSRGFANSDLSGVGATSFTFELGGGSLSDDTLLSELNGGQGVERGKVIVRDAAGNSATVDLSTARSVGDVLDAFNTASGVRVRASVDGDRLKISDANETGTGTLTISNATGYTTATSLGIAGSAGVAGFGQAISGARIRTISGASALSSLNDGSGVNIRGETPDLIIKDRNGDTYEIVLGKKTETDGTVTQTAATTLQEVIDRINTTTGNKVKASINADGTGIVLDDLSGGSSNLIVRSGDNGRTTAKDLGIETSAAGVASAQVQGRRLISSINSTLVSSLRGGQGITENTINITDRAGNTSIVKVAAAALSGSIDDVIADINSQLAPTVRVSLNRAGNGLSITDSGPGSGSLVINGAGADQFGLTTAGAASGSLNGTNLQTRWISRATQLADLNGGKGIGTGKIKITDAAGGVSNITISDSLKTVDDLLQFIKSAGGAQITAEVNANGDGLVIRDDTGSLGALKIEDVSGTVAKSLNLVGSDDEDGGVTQIVGSYEREVVLTATDSLSVIASKINAEGLGVSAAIIRDGSGGTPYRLSLTSQRSGERGRVVIDTKNIDLGLQTLARGDDSVAFYGAADPARGILLSSSSNTLDNVIQGVSIDLKQAGGSRVSITVSKDTAAVEKSFDDFVKAYNDTIDKLNRYDSFNKDTKQAGLLFGDGTISNIRSSLATTIQGTALGVSGTNTRLFQIGLKVGDGGKISIDKTKLRSALESDPAGVEALVSARSLVPKETQITVAEGITVTNTSTINTFTSLGVVERLGEVLGSLTGSVDGTLTRRGKTLEAQISSNTSRIEQLDIRLAAKRAKLERQFATMESAIGSLQSQGSAISTIRT